MLLGTRRALLGPWGRYLEKVLLTEPDNLIGCWLQNESAGSVSIDYSGEGNNGAYTGVTLGQAGVPGMGYTCPLFDGVNDYNNIYSAGLNADFNGAEGTLLAWAKVSGAGVWEDGTSRNIAHIYVDGGNNISLKKDTANNDVYWTYVAGGTTEYVYLATETSVDWICYVVSWTKSGNAMKGYRTAVQVQTTQTIAGTWAGNINSDYCIIGALEKVGAPSAIWDGTIGPVALWNKALTADQVAYLSTP